MSRAATGKRSVLDDRFLRCGECNERFWDNSKLVKHMESHVETKQLICTICNKTFSSVQDLDKHYLLHRVLMQPFGCPACEARFSSQDHLVKHVEKIHPELTIGSQENPSPETKPPMPRSKKIPPSGPKAARKQSPRSEIVQTETKPTRKPMTRSKIGDQGSPPKVETKTTRKQLPRSTRSRIRIEEVRSLSSPEKTPRLKEKSPGLKAASMSPNQQVASQSPDQKAASRSPNVKVDARSPNVKVESRSPNVKVEARSPNVKVATRSPSQRIASTKKSILKVAPTPAGKKRPVVWKSPVVSPEQKPKRNVASIQYQQSPGEKRKLVNASNDLSDPKKIKLTPAGPSKMPVTTTPVKKTPITKTKLMQNISNLYDNQPQEEKKTMAQTRKDLLNSVTVTPVTKGPIKVVRSAKPFIIYSPSKDAKTVQLVPPNIVLPKSPSVSDAYRKLVSTQRTAASESSQAFDKLLVSDTSPSASTSGITETKLVSLETKNQISPKRLSTIKIIPITQKSIQTVTPGTNTVSLVKNVSVIGPAGTTKLIQPVFPAGILSPNIKLIPQACVQKTVQPVPISKNILTISSPGTDSQKSPVTVTNQRSPIIVTNQKSPVTVTNQKSPIIVTCQKASSTQVKPHQFISEAEVHRDPTLKSQKLQIMFPQIKLRKITEAEFLKETKGMVGVVSKNPNEACTSEASGDKQPVKGVKRRGRQISQDASSSKQIKRDPTSLSSEQSPSDTKTLNKLTSGKGNTQKKDNPVVSVKTRRKMQSDDVPNIEETKPAVGKPPIIASPQSTRRNSAKNTTKPSKDISIGTEHTRMKPSNKSGTQPVKTESPSSEVPATRRSRRNLASTTSRKPLQQKPIVKKDILEKVIEEVNPIDDNSSEKATLQTQSSPAANSKIRVVTLTPEVMNKLKATVLKKTTSNTPNHIRLVVPSEVLSRIQNATLKKEGEALARESPSTSAGSPGSPLSNLKVSVVPKNVVRYGVEDLKRIKQKEQEAKVKGEILKQITAKFEEKEKKKQLRYCEKKITRFLDKHQEKHLDKVKDRLLNVRSLSQEEGAQLLRDLVSIGCKNCKEVIGKSLCGLGFGDEKDLVQDKAVEGLVALTASKARRKLTSKKAVPVQNVSAAVRAKNRAVKIVAKKAKPPVEAEPSSRSAFSIIECAINKGDLSYSKNADSKKNGKPKARAQMKNPARVPRKKVQKRQAFDNDPFVDVSIINTEEKFVIECPWCTKPNCDGLHPENFFCLS